MAPFASLATAALLVAPSVYAHFELLYPTTIGFSEETEPSAPCGGFTLNSSSHVTDFYVGGDFVGTQLFHAQASFLYRATLDTTASSNWTEITPNTVSQSGLGSYCIPVTVPAKWAGSEGVVSVVCDSPDGILYQCAAVNFVNGSNTATGGIDSCKNGSSVKATYSADTSLAALAANSNSGPSSGETAKISAAAPILGEHSPLPIASLFVLAAMLVFGDLLL